MKKKSSNQELDTLNLNKTILSSLPKNSVLHSFVSIYLQAIPYQSTQKHSAKELLLFIKERFKYVSSSLKKSINYQCYLPKNNTSRKDIGILEVVCTDARYLIESIESVLATYKCNITQLYHPIFKIKKDKRNNIQSIEKGSHETEPLLSNIYIEFDNVNNKKKLEDLSNDLYKCILATQLAHQSNNKIHNTLSIVHEEVKNTPTPVTLFHKEWVDLIRWLKDDNFSFFGYTEFELKIKKTRTTVTQVKNSGLGILDTTYTNVESNQLLNTLKKQVDRLKNYRSPFLFDIINVSCPIKISANIMRLSLKIPVSKTKIKEYNFIGLLRRSSLHVKNTETPIIRLKISTFLKENDILLGSYDHNQIIRYYTVTPKYELFRTPTKLLGNITKDLLSTVNPNDIYLFKYERIELNRALYMVVIPTTISSSSTLTTIETFLKKKIQYIHHETVVIQGHRQTRLHLYFEQKDTKNKIETQTLEDELKLLVNPWKSLLLNELFNEFSPTEAYKLYKKYIEAFPNHYKVMRTIKDTVRDIRYLELVKKSKEIQFNIVPFNHPDSVISSKASILIVYNKNKIDLTHIMPILQNLNIHVFDEVTTRIGPPENVISYIHSFRIAARSLKKINEEYIAPKLIPILKAIFKEQTSNDTLNGLILLSGTHWRNINILQTYRNYYLQLDSTYSKEKINNTLLKYIKSTLLLIQYFRTKFSTDKKYKNATYRESTLLSNLKKTFHNSLKTVDELAEDIILKHFFKLIEHTLRTNFFIKKPESNNFISIKIDSQKIKASHPTPYREIYVYDTEMEGCHLRFGPIARGGLRWSSRPFDYRKEVLGLVNTQQTKNVVIVPEGSKGGFITKNKTHNMTKNGIIQYQKFIMGLLDITDSLDIKGNIIQPKSVICYDHPDTYLVVAADKGTAQFSDIANNLSKKYNFWLGDAFASGGSNGYNHKEVGITAKGAWECVNLHFLEKGKNIKKDTFTVIGIGDMGGDVFGNGMLLSKKIQLLGAFNHIHIFIDPNPDEKASFKERQRLFKLEKSTWKDYDQKKMSKGGGIFERNSREIKLSTEIKTLLNTKKDTLNGEELIKELLKTKADLLWAGGIGTYIKADHETHMQVSDPSNDSVRINHSESNFSIIGEGANLCATTNARYELSKLGMGINTDFIDNSAGVNMSDYEVNIKILTKTLLETKTLKSEKERNKKLEKATEEITNLVLMNNKAQHQLLSIDAIRSTLNTAPFSKLIDHLTNTKAIKIETDSIYEKEKIDDFQEHKKPLPRPLLANLQSYVKMECFSALNKNPLPENNYLDILYKSYFPKDFINNFEPFIMQHPLKKEILNTLVTNNIVNQAGMTFLNDIQETSGETFTNIVNLYLTLNLGLGANKLRKEIHNYPISYENKYLALIELEKEIKNEVLHILQLPFELQLEHVELIQKTLLTLKKYLPENKTQQDLSIKMWQDLGFSKKIAEKLNIIHYTENISDLIYIKFKFDSTIENILTVILQIDELFEFKIIKQNLQKLSYSTIWEFQQIETLGLILRTKKLSLVNYILEILPQETIKSLTQKKLNHFIEEQFPISSQYFSTLHKVKLSKNNEINTISVLINRLNLLNPH